MYVARILYPVEVLGPGKRIGIWFAGCEHCCAGCSNPELWQQTEQYKTSLSAVMRLVNMIASQHPVDGFTLTGGDPVFQPDDLKNLLEELKKIDSDILLYTGYTIDEVRKIAPTILDDIAVLIDGKYIESRNNGSLLRGSDNQNIYVLNAGYQAKYDDYFQNLTRNEIQNFSTGDGIISVGIHRPDYVDRLREISGEKGLEEVK